MIFVEFEHVARETPGKELLASLYEGLVNQLNQACESDPDLSQHSFTLKPSSDLRAVSINHYVGSDIHQYQATLGFDQAVRLPTLNFKGYGEVLIGRERLQDTQERLRDMMMFQAHTASQRAADIFPPAGQGGPV